MRPFAYRSLLGSLLLVLAFASWRMLLAALVVLMAVALVDRLRRRA